MIIARLAGGLGNQMFQYAAGYRLARRRSVLLKLDVSVLLDRTPTENFVFRDYDLSVFGLGTAIATTAEVARFPRALAGDKRTFVDRVAGKILGYQFYTEPRGSFDPQVLELSSNTFLDGFFQDERYFKDCEAEIRKGFRIAPDETSLPEPTRKLADDIRREPCICLNVRRGDYVNHANANAYHGVCSMAYYNDALAAVRARGAAGRVFVFSDDVPWCRENFPQADGFIVVGHEHKGDRFLTYLWLMSMCSHFVIPNSSFAWWAAWLCQNPGKVVARPAQWARAAEVRHQDPCPPSWLKIPNVADGDPV